MSGYLWIMELFAFLPLFCLFLYSFSTFCLIFNKKVYFISKAIITNCDKLGG